jgi:hypothetical protein
VAIVLGAVIGNLRTVPASWLPGLSFASKYLLRVGIVLLGLQISLGHALPGWAGSDCSGGDRRHRRVSSTLWIGRLLGIAGPLRC